MFRFIKRCFFTGLAFLLTLTSVNLLSPAPLNAISLSCISMNNQECRVRPQIVNLNGVEPVFVLLELKQLNAMVVATITIIHMQNRVLLMLQKT